MGKLPPRSWLDEKIKHYWHLGYETPKIHANITADIEQHEDYREKYTIRLNFNNERSICRLLGTLELHGVRKRTKLGQEEDFKPHVLRIKLAYPQWGARQIRGALRVENGIRVSEKAILDYLHEFEPQAVKGRKHRNKFKRRRFFAAGVMDLLCVDQHDKWQRFGLYLHIGLDPFPGRYAWLKVWWTNRNPILITSYYLEAARREGGVPVRTMSDPGTENVGIACCHSAIRQTLDPSLDGTIQHKWMFKHSNIKPEQAWSKLRAGWSPGIEKMLEEAVHAGLFNIANPTPVERFLFRWLAIPWIQKELDDWLYLHNMTPRRADRHKVLPHGVPNEIHQHPDRFNAYGFKVNVPNDVFDEMERTYAPPTDPVFQLTSPLFEAVVNPIYESIGKPTVTVDTLWTVYAAMLQKIGELERDLYDEIEREFATANRAFEGQLDVVADNGQKVPLGTPANIFSAPFSTGKEEVDHYVESDQGDPFDGVFGSSVDDRLVESEEALLQAEFTDEEEDDAIGTVDSDTIYAVEFSDED